MTSGTEPEVNLAQAEWGINEAADQGATYVQLPEYFNYLGSPRRYHEVAEALPGPTTSRIAHLARARGVAVHLGSLLERSDVAGRYFNTSVVIDSRGDIVARYRKTHLFDVDVAGVIAHHESDVLIAGDEIVVVEVAGLHLGLSICFDLRFPELFRALALGGAQVLGVPAAFNASTGLAHWEMLVRARAIENHAFVVAAAQAGVTSEGVATYAHSMVVDPWGEVVALARTDGPEVLVASIDVGEVARRRAQIDVLNLRRDDLYGPNR